MRDDGDFAAYTAARWPPMVRSLVLLGCPQPEAEEVARTALARCHRAWARVRRSDDPDVHAYRTLLDCWARDRRRRRRHRAPVAHPPDPPAGEEPTDAVLLRRALEAELDRLDPEPRTVVVLRFVADLGADRLAEVLDLPVDTVDDRLAEALAGIDLETVREAGR